MGGLGSRFRGVRLRLASRDSDWRSRRRHVRPPRARDDAIVPDALVDLAGTREGRREARVPEHARARAHINLADAVAGEWIGYCACSIRALETRPVFLHRAGRVSWWGMEIKDWQSQCSTTPRADGNAPRQKRRSSPSSGARRTRARWRVTSETIPARATTRRRGRRWTQRVLRG